MIMGLWLSKRTAGLWRRAVGKTKSRLEIKAEIGAKLILVTEIQV